MVAFFSRLKLNGLNSMEVFDFGVVAFFSRLKLKPLLVPLALYFGVVAFFSRLKLLRSDHRYP